MGEYFCCLMAAGMPKMSKRHRGSDDRLENPSGEMPSIHIMVVVVSPTTLQAPPALDAATIAAR